MFEKVFDAISAWFTAREKVAELKYKQQLLNEEHKRVVKTQWTKLFSSEDAILIDVLERFSNNNSWREIDEYYQLEHQYFEVWVDDVLYSLFQESENGKIRINPVVYADFQKNLKQYLAKYGK